MTSSASSELSEFLTFFVEREEYAVPLRRVREVIPYDTVTRVPQLPAAVRGVTNLRGTVVPVVDVARLLLGADTPVDKRTCIVLVELALEGVPATLGLMTEAVGQVLALADAEIAPPPAFGAPVKIDYLRGMGRVGKKFALLLDLDVMLSARELLVPPAPPAGEVDPPPEAAA